MAVDWSSVASAASNFTTSLLNAGTNLFMAKKERESNEKIAQENIDFQREANEQNIAFQREVNAWNEGLMREGWARDDTARQRMVADLENAGLSKWLASGASPMTSSPITVGAPHVESLHNDYRQDYSKSMDAMNRMADAMSHLYSNYLQLEQTKKQTANIQKQNEILGEDLAIKEAEKQIKQHDAKVFANRPDVASTDPATLKYISEALNLLLGKNQTGQTARDYLSGLKEKAQQAKDLPKTVKEKAKKKVAEKVAEVNDFLTPRNTTGVKPLTMSEWMDLNGYTSLNQVTVKNYNRYKENFLREYR